MWVASAQAAESEFGDVNQLLGQKQCLKPPCKAGSVPIHIEGVQGTIKHFAREASELLNLLLGQKQVQKQNCSLVLCIPKYTKRVHDTFETEAMH